MFQEKRIVEAGGLSFTVDGWVGPVETARVAGLMAENVAGWPFGSGCAVVLEGARRIHFDDTFAGALRAALAGVATERDDDGVPVLAAADLELLARLPGIDADADEARLLAAMRPLSLVRIEVAGRAVGGATPSDVAEAVAPAAGAATASPWIVFAAREGGTLGGFHDLHSAHADEDAALEACRGLDADGVAWWHVAHDGVIVHDGSCL